MILLYSDLLGVNLTTFWTAGIFYLYREAKLGRSLQNFYDSQFGLSTSATFSLLTSLAAVSG
jgi:hypothetical protein